MILNLPPPIPPSAPPFRSRVFRPRLRRYAEPPSPSDPAAGRRLTLRGYRRLLRDTEARSEPARAVPGRGRRPSKPASAGRLPRRVVTATVTRMEYPAPIRVTIRRARPSRSLEPPGSAAGLSLSIRVDCPNFRVDWPNIRVDWPKRGRRILCRPRVGPRLTSTGSCLILSCETTV